MLGRGMNANAEKENRATCRNCKTRYDTSKINSGTPFSCRHCGEVIYAPGERSADHEDKAELPFGQFAVEMGYITTAQLATALKVQRAAGRTRLRLGDVLVEKGFLNPKQVSQILHRQGSRIAFLIPGYEIVEKLGQGGMGAVFKGVHLASRKTVAMKILAERLAKRPEFLERFHREARVAIDLDHPSIVKGFDEGAVGDTHYFVMEYVHGKSAGRVLKKRQVFGERRAMDITRQMANALTYAHARNIVHRDIKPDNIMLTRDGRTKLADYGLVKYMDDINEAGLTTEGQIMGTPNYISPEQASGRKDIDIRSDIYSLGATLYHMLTGKPPYEGSSVGVIMGMHVSSPVPNPRKVNAKLSGECCAVVCRMMAKQLGDRYQTPADLERDLEAYFQRKPTRAGGQASSAPCEVTPSAWDTVTPGEAGGESEVADEEILESAGEDHRHLVRTAPILFGLGFFLLVLGLAAAAITLWRREPGESPPEERGPEDEWRRPDASGVGGDVADQDLRAAELYKEALALSGEDRIRRLEELVRTYPRSRLARAVNQELAEYRRQQSRISDEEKKREQMDRELRSMRAYNEAEDQFRIDKDQDRLEVALEQILGTYPGSKGAREAQMRLQGLRRAQKTQKPPRPDPASPDPGAEREQKQREETARLRFIDAYRQACRAFDLPQALEWAQKLAEDKRLPGLERLGRDCEEDITDLQTLFTHGAKALETLQDDQEYTLTFGSQSAVKGRIASVKDGKVSIIVKGHYYTQPLTALADSEIERLFRAVYREASPPGDVVVGLYYFVKDDLAKAQTNFQKVHGQDPRRKHHQEMLRW